MDVITTGPLIGQMHSHEVRAAAGVGDVGFEDLSPSLFFWGGICYESLG